MQHVAILLKSLLLFNHSASSVFFIRVNNTEVDNIQTRNVVTLWVFLCLKVTIVYRIEDTYLMWLLSTIYPLYLLSATLMVVYLRLNSRSYLLIMHGIFYLIECK